MAIRQPHSHSHSYPAGTTIHTTDISFPHRRHTAQPTLQNTSTCHHPHPHSAAGPTHRFPPLHIAPLHSRTMLQSTLFQNDPRHHFIKPNNLPPPLNRCSPSLRLLAGHVSKADHILPPHQRHRHRPQPHLRTPGQHITKSQHNSNLPSSQYR